MSPGKLLFPLIVTGMLAFVMMFLIAVEMSYKKAGQYPPIGNVVSMLSDPDSQTRLKGMLELDRMIRSGYAFTRFRAMWELKKSEKPDFWKNYKSAITVFLYPPSLIYFLAFTVHLILFSKAIARGFEHMEGEADTGGVGVSLFVIVLAGGFVAYSILRKIPEFIPIATLVVLTFLVPLVFLIPIQNLRKKATLTLAGEACIWSLASGIMLSMPAWPFNATFFAYLCAGVSMSACIFIAVCLLSILYYKNSLWSLAKDDAAFFFCLPCMSRFAPGVTPHWLVRLSDRILAREKPCLHNDFRDYFVCRRCGSNTRLENIRTVAAVIDRPWEPYFRHDGAILYVNIVMDEMEIRTIAPDEIIIRNAPNLEYDYILQHLYLSLTGNAGSKSNPSVARIPVILENDPPLSINTRRLLDEWFPNVRTREV